MRRRFSLIVFLFLVASILVVSTLQLFFFENERMRLRDERLQAIASTLIASGLSLDLIDNLDSTDNLIHDLLGEERIDQIINIYSLDGDILAQNLTGAELPLEFNPKERWQTSEVKGRTVRVLNIRHGELLVQVGMILGPTLDRWLFFNSRFAWFIFGIFILLLVIAYFSSWILFDPLKKLTLELQSMSAQLDRKLGQPLSEFVIGPELASLSRGDGQTRDEFELLCAEIKIFLKKLESYTKSFHAQTAILTHELKTPLTILRNYLEDLKLTHDISKANELGKKARDEVDRLTNFINNYLQWSVLTSNPSSPNEIYAVKLPEMARKIISDFNLVHNGRIQIESEGEATVFAMPEHVRQLLTNLISNALNYSPSEKPVVCRLKKHFFEVEDFGSGIPGTVMDHLGSPFNRGDVRRGNFNSTGLGLAWVHSLCEKYHWKLDIHSSSQGTRISVHFP